MHAPRVTLAVVAVLILLTVSGWWLWRRLTATPLPSVAVAPTASPTASATAAPMQPPPGYRLAGVAVGEPDSFAVVESPNGASALYRTGAEVPGLGRLVRIEAERVVIQGAGGQFDLKLAPAATPTATAVRTPTARAATPKPRVAPAAGGTTPGSTPSGAPGRPVS